MSPSHRSKRKWSDTTEVLRLDQTGPYTELHLLVCTLHADMSRSTSSGSVATFTSDRALAQADEPTSHMKEKTTVTMKSCTNTAGLKWTSLRKLTLGYFFISALFLAFGATTFSHLFSFISFHLITCIMRIHCNSTEGTSRLKSPVWLFHFTTGDPCTNRNLDVNEISSVCNHTSCSFRRRVS